jgi:hypothetical protein
LSFWREAWRRDSRSALYGADGFHPTAAGSYLTAVVIYQGILRPVACRPASTDRLAVAGSRAAARSERL